MDAVIRMLWLNPERLFEHYYEEIGNMRLRSAIV